MKSWSKSATIRAAFVLFAGMVLSGCADSKWPSWFTGEPDESVINAPRVVGKPPSQHEEAWPLLGKVPEKPKNFSTPQAREKAVQRMTADQEIAQKIKERAERDPLMPATP